MAALLETDMFRMITNGLGRLANKGEAGYIVKVTKSFHSLALINFRQGKNKNMVLVLCFLKRRARVRENFFLLKFFYSHWNIHLPI